MQAWVSRLCCARLDEGLLGRAKKKPSRAEPSQNRSRQARAFLAIACSPVCHDHRHQAESLERHCFCGVAEPIPTSW